MWLATGAAWLEIFHYLGIAFWIGAVAMLDFQLLGLSRSIPVRAFHLSAGAYIGFGLTFVTGLLMLAPNPAGYMTNPMFILKIALLIAAVGVSLVFHSRYVRVADGWGSAPPPPGARGMAAVSLLLWLGVLLAGRAVTYFGFSQG